MRRRIAIAGAAALSLAGCGEPGAVFPVPAAEARAMLLGAEVPPMIFGYVTEGIEAPAAARGVADVEWTVRQNGRPVMRYTATLTPVDAASTRVAVRLDPADQQVAQRLRENGSLVRLYRTAMEEKVASTLERRPFRTTATYPALGLAIAANYRDIAADAAAAGEALRRRDEANIARAYAEEARGR